MIRCYSNLSVTLWVFTLLVLLFVSPGHATSTVDCHCFRERSFSSDNPQAFDSYLLVTTQNRLFAHAFRVERKEVVKSKMAGVRGDFLWITHWLARHTGTSVEEINELHARELSWRKVTLALGPDPEALGSAFMGALHNDDEEDLAWAVVSQVCREGFSLPGQHFVDLRRAGCSLKEAILATVLASMQGKEAMKLFNKARQLGSWGRLMVDSAISVESIEAYLNKTLPGS